MGRQAYMTRLVLGRSAFDPPETQGTETRAEATSPDVAAGSDQTAVEHVQEYDARGHPENGMSRDAARRSRRALNDILATAGICVPVKDAKTFLQNRQNAIDSKQREAEAVSDSEEEIGFWLQMVDSFGQWSASHVFTGFRLKLLAFNRYGYPSEETLRLELLRGGIKYLLRGFIAHALFNALELARDVTLEAFFEELIDPLVKRIRPFRRRARIKRLTRALRYILDTATYIALASIELHASLQQLELVDQPLFALNPIRTSFRCWSWSLLPRFPALWSLESSARFLASLVLSPPTLFYLLQRSVEHKDGYKEGWTLKVLEEAIPTPEDRSANSSLGPLQAGDSTAAMINACLGLAYKRATFEIHHQWRGCKITALKITELVSSWVRDINIKLLPLSTTSNDSAAWPDSDSTSQTLDDLSWHDGDAHDSLEIRAETDPLGPTATLPLAERVAVAEAGLASSQDQGVEARSNAMFDASNDTTSSPSSIDHREVEKRRKTYRTSPLSTHAADTLRYHVQWVAWDFLLIPLESLYARSLATAFLSMHAPSYRSSVYPVGSWCGTGSWLQRTLYGRNIFLCTGAEVAVSYGIWQVTTGVAWWIGMKWFRWGRF